MIGWVLAVGIAASGGAAVPAPAFAPGVAYALAPAASDDVVETLVADTRAAIEETKKDPAGGCDRLRAVLDRFDEEPSRIAASTDAHAARIDGLLALARAELERDREPEAIAALDDAIRIARGDPLPVADWGPRVAKLHDLRVGAPELRPLGSVHVTCSVQCRVILDGRIAGKGADVMITGLPLGGHQLRIEPMSAEIDHHFQTDVLLSSGEPERVVDYRVPEAKSTATKRDDRKPVKERKLPRWASIVGMGAGAAMVVAGAVLIAFDGKCPDGSNPMGTNACADVLNTDAVGIALTSIGAATLVGFSVALGVGEARDKKAGAAITIRF